MNRTAPTLAPAVTLGCLLGMLCFLCTYGISVVNPVQDGWILSYGGDLTQHYLGWIFFRKTPWRFPLGLTEGLIHETPISCMFTDSIPLLALPFKLLSPILPETFQYIGLWGLLSFGAQGGLSAAILHRLRPGTAFCALGSLLYILSPAVFQRALHHEALAGHWVILLALLLWMYQKERTDIRRPAMLWSLCSALAVLTHIYYLPMVCLLLMGAALTDVLLFRNFRRAVICIVSAAASALCVLYVLGAFYGESDLTAGGLGKYSANLNCLWNSMGYSRFLETGDYISGQTEGLGYLGLGALLATGTALLTGVCCLLRRKNHLRAAFSHHGRELLAGGLVLLADVFLAVSPVCTFGESVLYEIAYPQPVQQLLGVFRASGRFIWVAGYLILTITLGVLGHFLGRRLLTAALAVCACVQLADLSGIIQKKQAQYFEPESYTSPLASPLWDTLSAGRREIIFLPLEQDYLTRKEMYFAFGEYARRQGLTLSSFYLARASFEEMAEFSRKELELLAAGEGDPEVLYIFTERADIPEASNGTIYEIDGYIAVCVKGDGT